MSVQSLLQQACAQLEARQRGTHDFDRATLDKIVRELLPAELGEVVGQRGAIEGRTGMGSPADVPWVGIFPSQQRASAREGFYLVYLFAADGSAVYLSLNQGTENVKGGTGVLVKRTIDLRRVVNAPIGFEIPIDLRSANTRPRRYEAGSALARQYVRDQVPSDTELEADLEEFLGFMKTAEASGLRWDPEIEPIHLILKWSKEVRSDAVAVHREIAQQQGTVWWGRFAKSTRPSIDVRKLEALQTQLEQSIPTHAYLNPRDDLWRAMIKEIRTDPPSPDDARFPSFYKPNECNLFVRLGDFEEIDSAWLLDNVVLARHPDPDPARVASALGSQTNPLYVFELGGTARSDEPQAQAQAEDEDDEWEALDLSSVRLADVCDELQGRTKEAGLRFGPTHDAFIRIAVVSLATKRLLLLTGLSGSGKTRLAIAVGEWFGADRVEVVPVRPDWTGPDAIFGFENALSTAKDGRGAWSMTRSLEFILRASADPDHPYLLVLDEMNLAHVERYFADALSGIESRSPVVPHVQRVENEWRQVPPALLPMPENLFVVGTVNIDETTYMFSPKVLDRANTIEFRVVTDDLQIQSTPVSPIEPGTPLLLRRFLESARTTDDDDDWGGRSQLGEWLLDLHRLLSEHDREFGHRVFNEALRFGSLLADAGDDNPLAALDVQVLQKVLPRIHGSIRQIAEPLEALATWCWHGPGAQSYDTVDPLDPPSGIAELPLSFNKIRRMTKRLRTNHFVGFSE